MAVSGFDVKGTCGVVPNAQRARVLQRKLQSGLLQCGEATNWRKKLERRMTQSRHYLSDQVWSGDTT
jgi:hypothetical protein